ncbi:hypothetical protein ACFX19_012466 [Malus domestica]
MQHILGEGENIHQLLRSYDLWDQGNPPNGGNPVISNSLPILLSCKCGGFTYVHGRASRILHTELHKAPDWSHNQAKALWKLDV